MVPERLVVVFPVEGDLTFETENSQLFALAATRAGTSRSRAYCYADHLMDDSDPRPTPPEKPLACDCCDSGCDPCVYDVYADELDAYEKALAAWRMRHPEA